MRSYGHLFLLVYNIGRGFSILYGDLTEVGRTRPERTMSGVVRGMAESSVPVGSWLWRGNPAGMNSYGDRLHFSKRIAVLNS